MDRKNLFIVFLIPFLCTSCASFFDALCVKEVYNTWLILEGVDTPNVTVFCKAEKLNLAEFKKCEEEEISDENIIYFKNNNLIDGNGCYKIFAIPSFYQIEDYKKITLYFKVEVNGELYKKELYIRTLSTKSGKDIDGVSFKLESENGNTLSAVFTFDLHLTL